MSSNHLDIPAALDALAAVLPVSALPASLHEPEFGEREQALVAACLQSGWVSYAGPQVREFEAKLAATCDRRHAISTVSGTAALHAALMLAGVQRDEEVIIPALTFAATANAVAYCGAIPHLVDCEEQTLGIDPEALRRQLQDVAVADGATLRNKQTGRRIAAIVPVHVMGHPSDDDRIAAVAESFNLPLILDATESLGSLRNNRPAAAGGLISVLSFNGNKIITTGGGGAILMDDDELAERCRHITTTAKQPHRWEFMHDQLGYNYRMPNLNAALGLGQLERLADFVARKRALAARYRMACAGIDGLSFIDEPQGTQSNYWLNTVKIAQPQRRDEFLQALQERGLMARPLWQPMHRLPMYRDAPRGDLRCTDDLVSRVICLPSSPKLAMQ
jgi:perosamine synthetase